MNWDQFDTKRVTPLTEDQKRKLRMRALHMIMTTEDDQNIMIDPLYVIQLLDEIDTLTERIEEAK